MRHKSIQIIMWRVKQQRMKFLAFIFTILMVIVVLMSINLYTQNMDLQNSSFFSNLRVQKADAGNDAISHSLIVKCLVLTLDKTLLAFNISNQVTCFPFLGDAFNISQFDRVSEDTKQKLTHPYRQVSTAELSNNQSLNIFLNHERIWQHVSQMPGDSPVLVLEDDIEIAHKNSDEIMNAVVQFTRNRNISNYIVKLHNQYVVLNLFNWLTRVFKQSLGLHLHGNIYMHKCLCSTPYDTISTSAYIIDQQAASRLLFHAQSPVKTHVDVFIHDIGCTRQDVNLYILSPNLFSLSGRTSTHMHLSFFWIHLWLKGILQHSTECQDEMKVL